MNSLIFSESQFMKAAPTLWHFANTLDIHMTGPSDWKSQGRVRKRSPTHVADLDSFGVVWDTQLQL